MNYWRCSQNFINKTKFTFFSEVNQFEILLILITTIIRIVNNIFVRDSRKQYLIKNL